jgi:hypothetical protein
MGCGRSQVSWLRAPRRAFPGSSAPQWLMRRLLARSQWRDRAGFSPDFPRPPADERLASYPHPWPNATAIARIARRQAAIVQGTRTPPSHGGNRGSNPRGGTPAARSTERAVSFSGRLRATMRVRHEPRRRPRHQDSSWVASNGAASRGGRVAPSTGPALPPAARPRLPPWIAVVRPPSERVIEWCGPAGLARGGEGCRSRARS